MRMRVTRALVAAALTTSLMSVATVASASIRRCSFVGDGFGILGRLPDSGVGCGCGLSAGVPGLSTAGSWSCP